MNLTPDLDALRGALSAGQRAAVNALWEEYRARNRWLPRVELHARAGEDAVRAVREELGAPVLREGAEEGTPDYRLTFLGVLLSDQGREAEALLIRYLGYVRDRVRANPGIEWVGSDEVESALGLTPERSQLLRQLIRLSHWWGGGSGFGQRDWTVGIPIDVEELPDGELGGYVRQHVLSHFLQAPSSGLQIRPASTPAPEVPFPFLRDPGLARRLAADWHEAKDVMQVRGFKSAVLLAGAVLEATLRALLTETGASLSGSGLAAVADAAVVVKLLPGPVSLPPLLAEYAALVQPADAREVSRGEADAALRTVDACLRALAARLARNTSAS